MLLRRVDPGTGLGSTSPTMDQLETLLLLRQAVASERFSRESRGCLLPKVGPWIPGDPGCFHTQYLWTSCMRNSSKSDDLTEEREMEAQLPGDTKPEQP